MTPTTLAETILRDVPKDALAKIVYDAMRFERQNDTPDWADGGNSCAQAEARHTAAKVRDAVLAALTAALDPALSERAGEVVKALRACANGIGSFKTQKGDFGLCDDAADLITALLAKNAALRAERDVAREELADLKEAWNRDNDVIDAQSAQIAALTAQVEGLTGVLEKIGTLAPIEKPPEPYDENGWQVADTSDRHASMVAAKDMWEVADFARAALSTTEEGK